MRGYDPYTYRPMLRYFYNGGPLPQDVATMAKADPNSPPYMQSAFAFTEWLKTAYPGVYTAVAQRAPRALDPIITVASGAISPGTARVSDGPIARRGMAGLADLVANPVSEWGKTITDISAQVLQLASQRDIIRMNVDRAERGLPPIDPGTVAPQVQFGMAPDTQRLVVLGVGGALALGALAIFTRKRR